ncbi:hypothetical protein Tco_0467538 [Tanacetum coccineum]
MFLLGRACTLEIEEDFNISATVRKPASIGRIQKNLLDRVSQLHYPFSLPKRLKADNANLASHLTRACLMLAQAGFPFITVNTKEYHFECSGNYHKDNANLGILMDFFYFLDVIREATTLRLRWNPISIRIAPRMWSSSLRSVVYSVIGFILTLVLTGLLRTTLSTLEVLEGLVLKIIGAITLTVCITFDSCVEGVEFEVTGLDKAFVLSTLGRTEILEKE